MVHDQAEAAMTWTLGLDPKSASALFFEAYADIEAIPPSELLMQIKNTVAPDHTGIAVELVR
jgi:hypothetical protein